MEKRRIAIGSAGRALAFCSLLGAVASTAGCPVTQSQDTPVSELRLSVPQSDTKYWLYVPSYYSDANDWPLVVTLHGTHGWDGSRRQIMEWKYLAEQRGVIVAAPDLRSVQGILPVEESLWQRDLDADDRTILATIDDVCKRYRVDAKSVLLTGFSAGGYPMYYTGLRHPERFDMLIARGCNSSLDIFESFQLSEAARDIPIAIFWGRDDLKAIGDQSWQAIRWLSEHGFRHVERNKTKGGHLRRPDMAYSYWRKVLPQRHRR